MSTFLSNDKFGRENYTGEWRFGMITGMGRMVWKSGATYSGGTMNILPQNAFIQAYKIIHTE